MMKKTVRPAGRKTALPKIAAAYVRGDGPAVLSGFAAAPPSARMGRPRLTAARPGPAEPASGGEAG